MIVASSDSAVEVSAPRELPRPPLTAPPFTRSPLREKRDKPPARPLTRAPLSPVARFVSSGTEQRDSPHRPAPNFSATSAASALPRTSFATMRPSRSSRKLAGNAVTL